MVFRVEHFLGAGEAGLADDMGVHFTDADDARQHVLGFLRIRLMEHSLVAQTDGAGLVRVDTGNDEDLVLDLVGDFCHTIHVVQNSVFPISRTRADHKDEFFLLALEDVLDFLVSLLLRLGDFRSDRELFLYFKRSGKLALEIHCHIH